MGDCGLSACPADAAELVKQKVDYCCKKNGGDGAVTEFIEYLIEK
jgi:3-deoxy-D-manno-octulosonate 8-phosphate phosphatase (KDO 8-P phosphatase)